MYPDPDLAQLEWSARFKGFLQSATNEHNRLNHSLGDSHLTDTGRRRISSTLIAKREHRRQVGELLAPFKLDADVLVPAMTELLADSLGLRLCCESFGVFVPACRPPPPEPPTTS